ncbi:unnamed protein product [Rotaria sp. Silwood1]|nr:unnamed protein product [Rotaria sp. Silwood1]
MNFDLLCGRPLHIMWFQCDSVLRETDVRDVFITNLDTNIDNQSLYDTFSAFGNILSCKMKMGNHFETQEAVDNAIDKLNGMLLGGKKIYVVRCKPHNQEADSGKALKFTDLIITNFDDRLDKQILSEIFSKYGKILNFQVVKSNDGQSKGFGFCSFENPEEAKQAVEALNRYSIGDTQLYVVGYTKKKLNAKT